MEGEGVMAGVGRGAGFAELSNQAPAKRNIRCLTSVYPSGWIRGAFESGHSEADLTSEFHAHNRRWGFAELSSQGTTMQCLCMNRRKFNPAFFHNHAFYVSMRIPWVYISAHTFCNTHAMTLTMIHQVC